MENVLSGIPKEVWIVVVGLMVALIGWKVFSFNLKVLVRLLVVVALLATAWRLFIIFKA